MTSLKNSLNKREHFFKAYKLETTVNFLHLEDMVKYVIIKKSDK